MKVEIGRPPILKTFHLPTKEQLMNLKAGDFVKLRFICSDIPVTKKWKKLTKTKKKLRGGAERMWVKLTQIRFRTGYASGILESMPVDIPMKAGDKVKFHLLDIIAIMNGRLFELKRRK